MSGIKEPVNDESNLVFHFLLIHDFIPGFQQGNILFNEDISFPFHFGCECFPEEVRFIREVDIPA